MYSRPCTARRHHWPSCASVTAFCPAAACGTGRRRWPDLWVRRQGCSTWSTWWLSCLRHPFQGLLFTWQNPSSFKSRRSRQKCLQSRFCTPWATAGNYRRSRPGHLSPPSSPYKSFCWWLGLGGGTLLEFALYMSPIQQVCSMMKYLPQSRT